MISLNRMIQFFRTQCYVLRRLRRDAMRCDAMRCGLLAHPGRRDASATEVADSFVTLQLSHRPRTLPSQPTHECGQAQCPEESLARSQSTQEFIASIRGISQSRKYAA